MYLLNGGRFVDGWRSSAVKRAAEASDTPVTQQPPADDHSNLPEIGGSFGGFIALVVSLAVVVVLLCIAIFILLHKFKPDPYERHYRKTMFGKREDSVYETPLGPQGMRARFKNFFGFGKKNEGWMRANNGSEEWDPSDRNINPVRTPGTGESDARQLDQPFSPPRPLSSSLHRSSTSESIELSVPDTQQPTPGAVADAAPTSTYSDPFASPPLPPVVADGAQTTPPHDDGRFSVQSGNNGTIRSMRKFDGGTKFKEAIDFE